MNREITINTTLSKFDIFEGELNSERKSEIYLTSSSELPAHRSWKGYFLNPESEKVEYFDQLESFNDLGSVVTTKALIKSTDKHGIIRPTAAQQSDCYILSIGRNHLTAVLIDLGFQERREVEMLHLLAAEHFLELLRPGFQEGVERKTMEFVKGMLDRAKFSYKTFGI